MSKVRINDLARELEVKSKAILDALPKVGVTEKKTHSSSLEIDEAERVRKLLSGGTGGDEKRASRSSSDEARPKFDFSRISKPGDALKAITGKNPAEAPAPVKAPPPAVATAQPKPGTGVAIPKSAVTTPAPEAPVRAPRVIKPETGPLVRHEGHKKAAPVEEVPVAEAPAQVVEAPKRAEKPAPPAASAEVAEPVSAEPIASEAQIE